MVKSLEERTKELADYYRSATDNLLQNVKVRDSIFGENKPIYESERPQIEVLGALEIVGLHNHLERAVNLSPKSSAEDSFEFPYWIYSLSRKEDKSFEYTATFDKTEFIPDLFPGLNIEERVNVLEKTDSFLIYLATRNLRYYHEMNLYNKGKARHFQLNGYDTIPKEILSGILKEKIRKSGLVERETYIKLPENKDEERKLNTDFPPLYFEAIKEIAILMASGYRTGNAK